MLRIPYTVNEPGIVSATITDAASVERPLSVYPDRLELLLPPDTADGPALVEAEVSDDVGNTATRTLVVVLSGVIVPAEPSGFVRTLPRKAFIEPRLITDRVVARTAASYAVGATLVTSSTARFDALYETTRQAEEKSRAYFAAIRTNSDWSITGSQLTVTAAHSRSTETAIKRVDGLEYEDELLLLTI